MKAQYLIAALTLAVAGAGPAFAGEGNYDPFPPATNGTRVMSSPALADTGSESTPTFNGPSVRITTAGTLPTNGSEGVVQSANSLPTGFENGTAAYEYAQSVNRYFAAKAAHGAPRVAQNAASR